MESRSSHAHRPKLYRRSIIIVLNEGHPGLRQTVEDLFRHRHTYRDIIGQLKERFGVAISIKALRYFYDHVLRPQEQADAEMIRQARAQVKVLIEEMKADPDLDATKIAEALLACQILNDRLKLRDADIMDLYREQREREKLDLQRRALELREEQVKKMLASTSKAAGGDRERLPQPDGLRQLPAEAWQRIREIYGLADPPDPPAQPWPFELACCGAGLSFDTLTVRSVS